VVLFVGSFNGTMLPAYDVIGANLVVNPSFEQAGDRLPLPAAWSGTAKVYARDPGTGRGGTACLKFASADAKLYVLCTQKLHTLVRKRNGRLHVFAVNDGDGEGPITWSLPAPTRSIRLLGEGRPIPANGNKFTDELKKLAVKVYQLEAR